ncbi:MAG: dienelactone hydrolase family protein [Armatimonadota bacterium]
MSNHFDKTEQQQMLYSLLGDLPDRNRSISVEKISVEKKPGYVLEHLLLDLNGLEPVSAVFVKPLDCTTPTPVILFNHSHGGHYDVGKQELIDGQSYLQNPPYAEELTARGYSALCIDCWNFGERHRGTESAMFKEMLWNGQVLWGMMVYDSIRAVDYLVSRDDVDSSRIGTLGLSMGSTMAWWLAALDERVKVCIDICCLTDFQVLIETGGLDGHGIYYYVPGLLKHFTTSSINSLISPRPHLSLAGNLDTLTPPAGLDRIDSELSKVYAEEDAGDAWELVRYDQGHFENPDMRRRIIEFLGRWL